MRSDDDVGISKVFGSKARITILVTNHVFEGLTKYPLDGPTAESFDLQLFQSATLPAAVASSAYQPCFTSGVTIHKAFISGLVARA